MHTESRGSDKSAPVARCTELVFGSQPPSVSCSPLLRHVWWKVLLLTMGDTSRYTGAVMREDGVRWSTCTRIAPSVAFPSSRRKLWFMKSLRPFYKWSTFCNTLHLLSSEWSVLFMARTIGRKLQDVFVVEKHELRKLKTWCCDLLWNHFCWCCLSALIFCDLLWHLQVILNVYSSFRRHTL